MLQRLGIETDTRFIVVHPASGGSAHEWSAKSFGRAAAEIERVSGRRILITGIESEIEQCLRTELECAGAVNLCGRLSLEELIAVVERCDLLLANSTGVLHVAAALGRPVVGLYPNTPHLSA